VPEREKQIQALTVTVKKVRNNRSLAVAQCTEYPEIFKLTSVERKAVFAGQIATNLSTSWKLRA